MWRYTDSGTSSPTLPSQEPPDLDVSLPFGQRDCRHCGARDPQRDTDSNNPKLCPSSSKKVEDTVMSPLSSNECDASWPPTSSEEHEESKSPNSKRKENKSSLSSDSGKEIEGSNILTVTGVSSLSLTDSQQSFEIGSSSSSISSDINGLSTENVENDFLDSDSLNCESFNRAQVSQIPVTASILTEAVSQNETDGYARSEEIEHLNLDLDTNTENIQETTHDTLDPNSIEFYIKTKPLRPFEDLPGTELCCTPGVIMDRSIGIRGDIIDCSTWFNLNLEPMDRPLVSSLGTTIASFDMGSGGLRSMQSLMYDMDDPRETEFLDAEEIID